MHFVLEGDVAQRHGCELVLVELRIDQVVVGKVGAIGGKSVPAELCEWVRGVVIGHHYREASWPEEQLAPYQVGTLKSSPPQHARSPTV